MHIDPNLRIQNPTLRSGATTKPAEVSQGIEDALVLSLIPQALEMTGGYGGMMGTPKAVHLQGKLTGPDGEREIHLTKTFHPEEGGFATIHGDMGEDTTLRGSTTMKDGKVKTSALYGPDFNGDGGEDNVRLEQFLVADAHVTRGRVGQSQYEATSRWGGMNDDPGMVYNNGYILSAGGEKVTFETATQIKPQGGTEMHGRFGDLIQEGEAHMDAQGRIIMTRNIGPYHLTEQVTFER